MEDTGDGGLVRVLHVDQLGSERGPPEDMPTVRHALLDRVGSVKPMVREGVPKLWRRWPVDLVEQWKGTHDFFLRSGTRNAGAAHQSAAEFPAARLSR